MDSEIAHANEALFSIVLTDIHPCYDIFFVNNNPEKGISTIDIKVDRAKQQIFFFFLKMSKLQMLSMLACLLGN